MNDQRKKTAWTWRWFGWLMADRRIMARRQARVDMGPWAGTSRAPMPALVCQCAANQGRGACSCREQDRPACAPEEARDTKENA